MNECENANRLGAYYDGELSPAARAEMGQHLRQCHRCAAELARMGEISMLARSAPAIRMPPAVLEHLHQRVDLMPAGTVTRLAEALGAIAAAILVACAVGLVSQSQSPDAAGPIPVWEAQAVVQPSADPTSGGSEELLASWMVQDLSGKTEND